MAHVAAVVLLIFAFSASALAAGVVSEMLFFTTTRSLVKTNGVCLAYNQGLVVMKIAGAVEITEDGVFLSDGATVRGFPIRIRIDTSNLVSTTFKTGHFYSVAGKAGEDVDSPLSPWIEGVTQGQPYLVPRNDADVRDLGLAPGRSEPFGGNLSCWTAGSLVTVFRNSTHAGGYNRPTISAARRETESFQIALRSDADLAGITIAASDFVGGGGTITASNIKAFVCYYHYLAPKYLDPAHPESHDNFNWDYGDDEWETEPHCDWGARDGYYPDALPEYTRPINLAANRTQSIWFDVTVPVDAASGDFHGGITVSDRDGNSVFLPVKLHVYNFTLPVIPNMSCPMGLHEQHIAKTYGLAEGSDASIALWRLFYEMELNHRLQPLQLPVYYQGLAGDVRSPDAPAFIHDPRAKWFEVAIDNYDDPYFDIVPKLNACAAEGVLDRVLIHVLDEPSKYWLETSSDSLEGDADYGHCFAKMLYRARQVHSVSPIVKCGGAFNKPILWKKGIFGPDEIMVKPGTSNEIRPIDCVFFDSIYGHVGLGCGINWWQPIINSTTDLQQPELLYRAAAGELVTPYQSSSSHDKYIPNWLIQQAFPAHRVHAWQAYAQGVNGAAYWRTDFFEFCYPNAWTSPHTGSYWKLRCVGLPGGTSHVWYYVGDHTFAPGILPCPSCTAYSYLDGPMADQHPATAQYGEGMLIYPGKVNWPEVGATKPVASIRLKIARDMVDDFDYFKLAETRHDRGAVLSKVYQIIPGMSPGNGELYPLEATGYGWYKWDWYNYVGGVEHVPHPDGEVRNEDPVYRSYTAEQANAEWERVRDEIARLVE